MARAAIGIGANLGDAPAAVRAAIVQLATLGTLLAASRLYRTAPWGETEQPPFINAAALVETQLAPRELLAALKACEAAAGRVAGARWGPRVLDLDILDYEGVRFAEPDLTIPHARLHERAFALVPLAEIDARWSAMRDALPPGERAGVVELPLQ
jgi:2-amino-4-hydroxy-6-hydroxymethyldihydropteridine diphosphokinase